MPICLSLDCVYKYGTGFYIVDVEENQCRNEDSQVWRTLLATSNEANGPRNPNVPSLSRFTNKASLQALIGQQYENKNTPLII